MRGNAPAAPRSGRESLTSRPCAKRRYGTGRRAGSSAATELGTWSVIQNPM
jgi:hypothetical protein